MQGGLHCIAAGMNWSPTDKFALEYINESDIKNLSQGWVEQIKKLNKAKEECQERVKKEPNLYSVLERENK